ncbi:hypothetical protein [Alkaliphilus hydrothermalis]|uniref:Uncharacterized protein n=1 Tax=Alkaliphilus hydrothermalis TaxID=1482730 RepID=A0ABS2NS92_9FIRM|nr:hypothetical protein [Alkaliphilus hydrothermalis]MBM7615817.1 hypothetical protein [Alkaliphilus hydrothermalis]
MIDVNIYNWLIGFILPWIAGIYLYKRKAYIMLLITPFASIVSYVFNSFGYFYGFWHSTPLKYGSLSTLPMNIGLFGILGSIYIYTLELKGTPSYLVLLTFTGVTTLMETVWVYLGFVVYKNSWSFGLTFLSYLFAYLLVHWYYLLLKKHHLLPSKI